VEEGFHEAQHHLDLYHAAVVDCSPDQCPLSMVAQEDLHGCKWSDSGPTFLASLLAAFHPLVTYTTSASSSAVRKSTAQEVYFYLL
jgi:hypothetical protein